MRKNNFLIITLMLFSSVTLNAQRLNLGLQSGIGFYDMKDLKELNSSIFRSLPFKAKMLSDYPPYLYYKPSLLVSFKRFKLGIQGAYYSSGTRISSKDYSGEYRFDTKINCIAPGLFIDYQPILLTGNYKVYFSTGGGFTFSKMWLYEDLKVNTQELTHSEYNFNAKNYFIEPGLKLGYNLYSFLDIELVVSYFFQFGKEDFVSAKGEILNDGKHGIGPDWNGLRIGLSFTFIKS